MPADIPPQSAQLPKRPRQHFDTANQPPVWSLDNALGAEPVPLQAKCARHDRTDGICCRELKGDDERTLIDPDVVRDVYVLFPAAFFIVGRPATLAFRTLCLSYLRRIYT